MKFFNLKDKSEYIPIVATWFHEEWAHLNPTRTYEDLLAYIERVINSDEHDQIFICLNGEAPVSSVSLRAKEADTPENFSPWLSSLVVDRDMRNQGIGVQTIRLFEDFCAKKNVRTVYLFTETEALQEWYSKQEWTLLKKAVFKGHDGFIMSKSV